MNRVFLPALRRAKIENFHWKDLRRTFASRLVMAGTIYEAILEGLRQEHINLIVALGFDQDPARLGPQPAHARIERYLPLTLLLPRCDLLITHGGFNSVKESLAAGVPMIVIPISGDQPYSAQRCAELGLAVSIPRDARTPSRLRHAMRDVLEHPRYRRQAQSMQRDMADLPGLDRAVALLEELHGRPRDERHRVPVALHRARADW